MALTKKQVKKRLKDGRGDLSKHGKNYYPFYDDRDTQLFSNRPIIYGHTIKRKHYGLSDLEGYFLEIFDWFASIVDIREQAVLDRIKTDVIYEQLGLNVPRGPVPLTIDVICTYLRGGETRYKPISIKYIKSLESEKAIKPLEVKRVYFDNLGADWDPWGLVTERDFSDNFLANIKLLRHYISLENRNISEEQISYLSQPLTDRARKRSEIPLNEIAAQLDKDTGQKEPVTLQVAYYLIANRKWVVNLQHGPVAHHPVKFKYIAKGLLE